MLRSQVVNISAMTVERGELQVNIYASFMCGQGGYHHLKKSVIHEDVVRVEDRWQWLQDALVVMAESDTTSDGWEPWDSASLSDVGCDCEGQ